MLCKRGEILARAYLRSRASFESARGEGPIENVSLQRRLMNAAMQKIDVHLRTCRVCDLREFRSAELLEREFGSLAHTRPIKPFSVHNRE
jgi:hypothetical protein